MPESPDLPQDEGSTSVDTAVATAAATRVETECPELVDLSQVLKDEHPWIRERREAAGFKPQTGEGVPPDLVGLAFSGGGIRSASFNLGVLQALYQGGFLRFVDFLSTVSGGGYIGAFFSSRVRTLGDQRLYETLPLDASVSAEQAASNGDKHSRNEQRSGAREAEGGVKIGLKAQSNGTPSPAVQELLDNGQYLNHPLQFFNRYLFGLALNNIVIFSLLAAICIAIAYLWRCLDFMRVRWAIQESLAAVGGTVGWLSKWITRDGGNVLDWFGTDKGVNFLPAFLLLAGWILLWCASLFISKKMTRGRALIHGFTRALLMAALICGLIGCAVLLGNSKLSVTAPEASEAVPSRIGLVVAVLGVLGLLPILRPWRLIGSGQRPRSQLETYLFRIACTALLVGVPLFLVFLAARENVSGYGDHSVDNILKWRDFAERIRDERAWYPAKAIWDELAKEQYDLRSNDDLIELTKDCKITPKAKEPYPLQHALDQPDVTAVFGLLQHSQYQPVIQRRQLVLKAVNRVMSNEEFPRQYFYHEPARWILPTVGAQFQQLGLVGPVSTGLYALAIWPRMSAGVESAADPISALAQRSKVAVAIDADKLGALHAVLDKSKNDKSAPNQELLKELRDKYNYLYRPADERKKGSAFDTEFLKLDYRRQLSQLLLAQHFAGIIQPKQDIVSRVVVVDADQQTRLRWLFMFLLLFAISVGLVNLNSTSLHGFYREQLAAAYVDRHSDGRSISLRQLKYNTNQGAPFHLLSATMMRYRSIWELFESKQKKPEESASANVQRTTEPTELFTFSPNYCGAESTGFRPTKKFKVNGQRIQLADAMAISGAAVTPLQVRNALVRVLMMILNIRLGQWLPNPARPKGWLRRPSIFHVLLTVFRKASNRSLCFVTDGGHHENLGAWPLLQRHCRLIVVCDASQDTEHAFDDFLRLCRRARLEQGINLVELEPDPSGSDVPFQLHALRLHPDGPAADAAMLRSLKDRFSRKHYILARIRYSTNPAEDGLLVYVKASLTGDEESDLVGYCKANTAFPHDPTSDTMFEQDQVESYRQLGFHIADGLCRDISKALENVPASDGELHTALKNVPPSRRLWSLEQFLAGPIVAQWMRAAKSQPPGGPSRKRDLFERVLTALTRLSASIDQMQSQHTESESARAKQFEAIASRFTDLGSVIQDLKIQRDQAQGEQRTVIDSITLTLKQFLELIAASKSTTRASGGLILSAEQWENLRAQLRECQRELEPPLPRKRVDLATVRELIQNCLQMIESAELESIKRP